MKLYELHNTLLEYRRDVTIQKQGTALVSAAQRNEDNDFTAEQIVTGLEKMDPTKNKSYMMWLIRQYTNGKMRLEDAPRIRTALAAYHQAKPQLPQQQRDVNRFDLHSLEDLVDSFGQSNQGQIQDKTQNKYKNIEDLDILYDGPLGLLAIPKTEEASCEIGSGTRWCTAARENNLFDYYTQQAPLYVFIERPGNTKYQFHFAIKKSRPQMMDARDRSISTEKMQEFMVHPVLGPIFKKWIDGRDKHLLKKIDTANVGFWRSYTDNLMLSIIHYKEYKNGIWPEFEDRLLKAVLNDYKSSYRADDTLEIFMDAQRISNNPEFKNIDHKEIDQKLIDYFIFEVRNKVNGRRVANLNDRDRRAIERYYDAVKNGVWPRLEEHIINDMLSNITNYIEPGDVIKLFLQLQEISNNDKFKNIQLSDILDGEYLRMANMIKKQYEYQTAQ